MKKTILTASILEDWLHKSEVIDILFGPSFHQDLASKSDALIIFMALRGILTIQHLQVKNLFFSFLLLLLLLLLNNNNNIIKWIN